MVPYKKVVIIYNPQSTGDSPALAQKLQAQLQEKLPAVKAVLQKTEHAGHAEELAYAAAASSTNSVIVSVSGDGGFNEVINGALRAAHEKGTTPICTVLPGGNANDHYKSLHRRPLIKALVDGQVESIDVMQIALKDTARYAHSYIGLGLTPLIAEELNKHTLSRRKEFWLTAKTYWRLKPFEIRHDGQRHSYDSILMTTVSRMAKHLTLSRSIAAHDGNFALLMWPHRNKFRLAKILIRAALRKPLPKDRVQSFTFTTTKSQPVQLDGELLRLPGKTKVCVTIQPQKLRTLL